MNFFFVHYDHENKPIVFIHALCLQSWRVKIYYTVCVILLRHIRCTYIHFKNISSHVAKSQTFKTFCVKLHKNDWPNEKVYRWTIFANFVFCSKILYFLNRLKINLSRIIFSDTFWNCSLSTDNATIQHGKLYCGLLPKISMDWLFYQFSKIRYFRIFNAICNKLYVYSFFHLATGFV